MKKVIGVLIAIALMFGVAACISTASIPKWFESRVVYGAEVSNTTVVEGNIMAVFYLKADNRALFWVTNAQIIDRGDGKWDVLSPQLHVSGVNQATVDYGLYKYKPLPDLGSGNYYLDDLDLQDITWDDLPKSMHVGALVVVDIPNKNATVARLYMGKRYDIPNCFITQDIVDAWTNGKLKVYNPNYDWKAPENVDCFVLVCFIREAPYSDETMISVIVDKVIK